MKTQRTGLGQSRGFTLVEMMVSMAALAVIMGAVMGGIMAIQRSIAVAENYPLGQMHLPDYIAMDARRASNVEPNPDTATLLRLTIPNIYNADGTKASPTRTKVSTVTSTTGSTNGKSKGNPHKYTKISYDLSWGTNSTVLYTISNGTVYRKVDSKAPVAISSGVQSITFDPIIQDLDDPEGFTLTTRLQFTKYRLNKANTPSGSVLIQSSTFLRNFVYAN